jgi:hypothetical protein
MHSLFAGSGAVRYLLVGEARRYSVKQPTKFKLGFVSYGADGRVHAFVVKRSRPTPTSLPPFSSEEIELFDSMFAYAGTYMLHGDHVVSPR